MQLSIKARLIIAFSLLVGLSSVIFYLGNSNSNELNNWTTTIIKVYTKRIMVSGKIAEDIQFITKREKEIIINTEADVLQELVRDIENRMSELDSRVDQLKEVSDESGEEAISNFTGKWQEYLKNYSKIKTLAVVMNTDSSNAVAYGISKTTARQTALDAVSVMNQIIKKNEKDLVKVDEDTNQLFAEGQRNMIILLVIGIIMSAGISYWIITSISKSIDQAKQAIKSVSEGDLTVSIDTTSKDEIGELLVYLQEMVSKLKEVIGFVTTASDNIASASGQMSSSSQQVSQGATEQAASAEEVSSSMEEMTSNIQQNTDNAQQTEKIALQAAEDIKEGSTAVSQTVESMKTIAEKISIIGEIARQTNLLALNAAVEAARAGEHGKGFAVVAAEVRKLAERSQHAATEIDALSKSSVAIAEKSGKLLEQIVPNIQKTSRLVQEIAASSMEQNSGAEQVNSAIQQLNQVIQQNATASEEMATSSEELSSQAEQLKDTISFFKLDTHTSTRRKNNTASKSAHTFSGVKVSKKSRAIGNVLQNVKQTSNSNGVHLNMGSDSLDEEYEKY